MPDIPMPEMPLSHRLRMEARTVNGSVVMNAAYVAAISCGILPQEAKVFASQSAMKSLSAQVITSEFADLDSDLIEAVSRGDIREFTLVSAKRAPNGAINWKAKRIKLSSLLTIISSGLIGVVEPTNVNVVTGGIAFLAAIIAAKPDFSSKVTGDDAEVLWCMYIGASNGKKIALQESAVYNNLNSDRTSNGKSPLSLPDFEAARDRLVGLSFLNYDQGAKTLALAEATYQFP